MTEFTKRTFTLPEELDNRLDELAEHHASVSACLRCAIEDHERTLNGNDEFAIQELKIEIESLQESVEMLSEKIEKSPSAVYVRQDGADHAERNEEESASNEDPYSIQQQTQRLLLDLGPLSLEQLTEQVDADLSEIQDAIEALVDREYIVKETENDPVRYRIKR